MTYPCAACGGFYHPDCPQRKNAVDCGLQVPCVPDRDLIRASDQQRRLTKRAQVGNTVFHEGVSERLVIERAQREYEYEQTPERQALRKEQLTHFMSAIEAIRSQS